jgi:hypothetical protein
MKIIIEHNGIKRIIEGTGFNICASPEDLKTIAETITSEDPKGYGWMKIRDPQPDEHSAPSNTKPIPWTHLCA